MKHHQHHIDDHDPSPKRDQWMTTVLHSTHCRHAGAAATTRSWIHRARQPAKGQSGGVLWRARRRRTTHDDDQLLVINTMIIFPLIGPGNTKAAAIAGAALCWCGYSAVQKVATTSICRSMRFLAERRDVGGNATLLLQQFDGLPTILTTSSTSASTAYSVCLFGDPVDDKDVVSTKRLWKDKLVVKKSKDKSNRNDNNKASLLAVYGRPREMTATATAASPASSIDALVKATTRHFKVVTNPVTFTVWMAAMYRLRAKGLASQSAPLRPGTYYFAFRDYWNSEEEWQLQCQRWSIQNLVFRALGRSRLDIRPDGEAKLRDACRLFGVVPCSIEWTGQVDPANGRIVWHHSCLNLGLRRLKKLGLYKIFDRPAAAEKLRVDPWKFYTDPASPGFVVFEREACGMLTFFAR
jgi:hypothetical protein